MNTTQNSATHFTRPDISIIVTSYNEEEIIGYTIPRLITTFKKSGYHLELVAVDNGSWDRTGEIIKRLATQNASVIYRRVEKNEGYGNGVLSGIQCCTAPIVGIIPADGQVDAEDVVRLYEAIIATNGKVIAKARRRFRMDGLLRSIISITYNLFVWFLFPRLASHDINGNPKILRRDALLDMRLTSKGWFLDPEIMIKAYYMGLNVLEFNVFARMRSSGISHVHMSTCWEFVLKLISFRFSREVYLWRQVQKTVHP